MRFKMISNLSHIQRSIIFGPVIMSLMVIIGWAVGNVSEVNSMSSSVGIFLTAFFILSTSFFVSIKNLYLATNDLPIKDWSISIWLMLLFTASIIIYVTCYTFTKNV